MDIGSILLILTVLVPVVLFIARPLMERSATEVTAEEHQYSALLAERDRILNAIQELDFDYTLEKIPEGDYPGQRANLMRAGADVLRQIDEYEDQPVENELEDRIESAIADRRNASVRPDPNDELEILIANRLRLKKENGQPKTGGFCPQCGNCVQESDKFCPKCGISLA